MSFSAWCAVTHVGRQYDYQKGQLNELLDVIIEEKTALFVCAVGVPPPHAVEKLHKAGIPIMNVRRGGYRMVTLKLILL